MGGVLYRRCGLTEESCSGGSTGQRTHTGEEPERRTKCRNLYILFEIKTIFKFNLCISLSLLPTSECRMTQNPVSVMAYEEEQYCLLIRILKPPPWKDLCHVFHADFFYIKAKWKA